MTNPIPSVRIFNVPIHTLTLDEVLALMVQTVQQQERMVATYVNAHVLNIAYTTPWFRDYLNQCTIVFCDGFGVKWGAKLLGYNIPERFSLPDWIDRLAQTACQHNYSLYLLGTKPGVVAKTATLLEQRHPGLRIVGTHHGYFDKRVDGMENRAVIQAINAAKPDILIVGLGTLHQEHWLKENWHSLEAHVALAVGAAFDYVSGEVARGPRWMTDNGLEWLSRLVVEPRRLWRRYVIGNPLFLWRILLQRVRGSK